MDIDQSELLKKLASDDIGTQILCLEEVMAFAKSGGVLSGPLKSALIGCFLSGEYRPFVTERLVAFAGQLESELRQLLESDSSSDVKFWTSMLLSCIDVRDGVPLLVESVRSRSHPWYRLAAMRLAAANEQSVVPAIIGSIGDIASDGQNLQVKDGDEIAALIDSLRRLGVSLPPELFEKLSTENTPWQIRAALGLPIDREKAFGPRKG